MSEWLRRQMRDHAVSTSQLAERTGVAPNTVTAWRTGRRTPSAGSSRRIAEVFEADPNAVLTLAGWPVEG